MVNIPDQTKWFKVFQNTATDLKVEMSLAALSEIIVKQVTPADLKALVEIAAGQSVEVTQATPANLKNTATLAGLQGIIPSPINALRVGNYLLNVAGGTSTIATVPEDKKWFITSAWVCIENQSAALNKVSIQIRTAVPAVWFEMLMVAATAGFGNALFGQYRPAIEVVEFFNLALWSPAANVFCNGGFLGWEEDI